MWTFGTPVEARTSFAYDYQGNRTHIFLPDNTSLMNKYDSLGRLSNRFDAVSSTTFWYNNQGLLAAVRNGVGQVSATRQGLDSDCAQPGNRFDFC